MKSLFALALLFLVSVVNAAQTLTYTITKPPGYFDGTAFGTEQLVYVVYNVANDGQLFSTLNLTGSASNVPDDVKCVYVRAAVYNVTTNSVIVATLSDPSPSSCKPAPMAKKVGTPAIDVKW